MKISRSVIGMAAVFGTAVVTGGWFLQQRVGQDQNVYFQARLLQEIVDRIASDYVEPVPRDSIYRDAIDDVVCELGDPHSSFMEARDYEDLRIRTSGDYGGVGLEITERDGFVTVVGPIPGSPGARAGILPGDQFFEIEGQPAAGWEDDEAVDQLRGEVGTDVHVKIRRPGVDEPIPFTLRREQIHLSSVPFALALENGIAYVPLQVVRETSSAEVTHALDSLKAAGSLKGLVLDLRGNPGGLLEQGIAVSDLFVPKGAAIVETRGRSENQTETYSAARGDHYPGLPIVALLDEHSASASEIIAGALQDHDRAVVVGMPSYGKGSVQTLFKVSGGNVLRLTTARWFTPIGRSIDKPHEAPVCGNAAAVRRPPTEGGTRTLSGTLTQVPVLDSLPVLASKGGRKLYGGGGITPDVIVLNDTLTTPEQEAVRVLSRHAGTLRTSVFDYAVRLIRERRNLDPDFVVGDQELGQVYESMADSIRSDIPRETYMRAARFIRYDIELEVALQKWGQKGEFQKRIPYDPQLAAAVALLRRSDSPEALFRAATDFTAAR